MTEAIKQRAAALTKADFTLKGVKTFRGMEGEQYEATIVCQGVSLAHVWDDGWGGCLNVDYLKPEAEKLINEFCSLQPSMICEWIDKETGKPGEIKYDIEMLAGDLMDKWHEAKEAKRWAKLDAENVMFRLKGDSSDAWRSIKLKQKDGRILDRLRVIEHIKQKHGDKLEAFYGCAA